MDICCQIVKRLKKTRTAKTSNRINNLENKILPFYRTITSHWSHLEMSEMEAEHVASSNSNCTSLQIPIVVVCIILVVIIVGLCILICMCKKYNAAPSIHTTHPIPQLTPVCGFTNTDAMQDFTEQSKTMVGSEKRTMHIGGLRRMGLKSGSRLGYSSMSNDGSKSVTMLKPTHEPTYEDVIVRQSGSDHRTSTGMETGETTTRITSGSGSGGDSERQHYERQNRVALKLKKAQLDSKDLISSDIVPEIRNEKLKMNPDD